MQTNNIPPKFVPTLTEIVQPGSKKGGQAPATNEPPDALWAQVDEQALSARIMQDLDISLESSLRRVVSDVVSEHVARMVPVLRAEIELQVREAVRKALASQLR